MKKILWLLLVTSCTTVSTQTKYDIGELKQQLLATDSAFSALSNKVGTQAAFLQYMDEHVTMMRPNSMPLTGKDTMRKIYATRSDTGFRLVWQPLFANAAQSGDLGYTYGTWQIFATDSTHSKLDEGTYTSIWKRDSTGAWKFILDTGNEGLKPAE